MRTILVTGANGFVGSRLTDILLQSGCQVVTVTRKPFWVKGAHNVVVKDLNCADDLKSAFQLRVDAVIHLAARVHVLKENSPDSLQKYRAINLDATKTLALKAHESGVKRFVFTSSVKVHGEGSADNPDFIYTEDSPLQPQNPYGVTKLEAENALREISRLTGLEVSVLRPPLVYGPGVKANFAKLITWVRRGVPLPFAKVCNRRSFVFVDNLAHALNLAASLPQAAGQTYLIDDGCAMSTPELIRLIAKIDHRSTRLLPVSVAFLKKMAGIFGREDLLTRLTGTLAVDSSKIRKSLNWVPPFSTLEGLTETMKFL